MEELCQDVILEINFMKLYSKIEFEMHGPQKPFTVNTLLK